MHEEIGSFTEILLIFVSMQGSPFVFKDNIFENVTKYTELTGRSLQSPPKAWHAPRLCEAMPLPGVLPATAVRGPQF